MNTIRLKSERKALTFTYHLRSRMLATYPLRSSPLLLSLHRPLAPSRLLEAVQSFRLQPTPIRIRPKLKKNLRISALEDSLGHPVNTSYLHLRLFATSHYQSRTRRQPRLSQMQLVRRDIDSHYLRSLVLDLVHGRLRTTILIEARDRKDLPISKKPRARL